MIGQIRRLSFEHPTGNIFGRSPAKARAGLVRKGLLSSGSYSQGSRARSFPWMVNTLKRWRTDG